MERSGNVGEVTDGLNTVEPEIVDLRQADSLRGSSWSAVSVLGGFYLIAVPFIHPSLGEEFFQLPVILQWVLPAIIAVVGPLFCVYSRTRPVGARFQCPTIREIQRETLMAIPFVIGIVFCDWMIEHVTLAIWPDVVVYPATYVDMAITPVTVGVLWFMLTGILWAPIEEEIIFRGFLLNALRPRLGTRLAMLVQGVVFGMVHFYETIPTMMVIMSGIVFGVAYYWRKNIICPMMIHAGLNLVAFGSILMAMAQNQHLAAIGVVPYWETPGCIIHSVDPVSPAARAGLLPNDQIEEIDGFAIGGPEDLFDTIASDIPGSVVAVTVLRDGRMLEFDVDLCQRSELSIADWSSSPVY